MTGATGAARPAHPADPARPAQAARPADPADPAAARPADPADPAATRPADPADPAAVRPADPADPAATRRADPGRRGGRVGLSREAGVAAAARLVDDPGAGPLTLARVAEACGVRTPSLYAHVGGLDDLHRLLALRALGELAAVLRRAAVGRAGDDALLALARAYRDHARTHPGTLAALQRAPAPDDAELQAAAGDLLDVLLAVLAGYGLTGDDAVHAARGLRSALHGFVTLEAGGGFGLPLDLDDSYDRLVGTLADGFARAGAPVGAEGTGDQSAR